MSTLNGPVNHKISGWEPGPQSAPGARLGEGRIASCREKPGEGHDSIRYECACPRKVPCRRPGGRAESVSTMPRGPRACEAKIVPIHRQTPHQAMMPGYIASARAIIDHGCPGLLVSSSFAPGCQLCPVEKALIYGNEFKVICDVMRFYDLPRFGPCSSGNTECPLRYKKTSIA